MSVAQPKRRGRSRTARTLGFGFALLIACTAARAQEIPFDVSAGSLAQSVNAVARQAGLTLSVNPTLLEGRTAPALQGEYTARQALDLLLSGTGIIATFADDGTVTLTRPGDTGAMVLDPVRVEAAQIPGRTQIGNLPPEFAGGQVARGGRMGLLGNRDLFDMPFNITSYTADLIEDQGAESVADVLHNDSSAYLVNAERGSSETIVIRGFNIGGNSAPLFDGLPGIAHRRQSTVGSLERVEVFKGANALLTGAAGQLGGSVNLVPKRPLDEDRTRVTALYEPDSHLGAQLDISRRGGDEDRFGLRVNGTYRDGESVPDHYSLAFKEASIALDYRGDKARSSFVLDYSDSDDRAGNQLFFGVSGLPQPAETDGGVQQPWETTKGEFLRGLLRVEYDFAPDWTAYGAYGATDFKGSWLRTIGGGLGPDGSFNQIAQQLVERDRNQVATLGVMGEFETGAVSHELSLQALRNETENGANNQSIAGYAVTSNIYDPVFVPRPSFTPQSPAVPIDTESDSDSLAIADTMGFLDEQVQVTMGLRRQRVDDERATTPALGIVYRPVSGMSVYGNYIEALEGGPTAPDGTENAGEVFAPSRTNQVELGVKIDRGTLGLTADVFQIEQPSGIIDETNRFVVDGEQRNRGIELNAFGELRPGIRLLAGLTYLDAELTRTQDGAYDGKTPSGIPDLSAVLGMEWDTPSIPGLTLSFRGNYTSGRYISTDNDRELSSYDVYHVGARYQRRIGEHEVTFRFNVDNLFGEDYWITFPTVSNFLYYGSPRIISMSARVDF